MNYLILPSNSIGGSEIRFVNNWIYSKQAGIDDRIKLVITNNMLQALMSRKNIYTDLECYREDIIVTDFPADFLGVQNRLKVLIEEELPDLTKAGVLLQVPLRVRRSKRRKFVYIYPGSSFFADSNFKGKVGQLINIFKADEVDVLDPKVYSMLRTLFFYKRNSFHLTQFGINQHSLELVSQNRYEIKQNNLAFVGRFIVLKQVIEFLDCVKQVYDSLHEAKINNLKFIVVGHGPLEHEVKTRVEALVSQGVDIQLIRTDNPFDILFQSKIYFSLQKHNNYPSQSLIEAILCGCLPIVTNCGSSERLLDTRNAYLVNEKFSPKELAAHCVSILSLDATEFRRKSEDAILYLVSRYSPRHMAEYYHRLLS